jgi:DNA polymerase-4
VASNKFLAKLASDLNKPDGLTIINAEDVDRILPPLPVTRIWGIGPKTSARLARLAIQTIADIRALPLETLTQTFGVDGERYFRLARGLDDRKVVPDSDAKSIGHEQTFGVDLSERDAVRSVLLGQVEQVAWRLRKHGLCARSVQLKIRDGSFHTITRAATLSDPSNSTRALWDQAKAIFDKWAHTDFKPVRLIGMSASNLTGRGNQMGLFSDRTAEQQARVDHAVDRINARFGRSAIRRGRSSTA